MALKQPGTLCYRETMGRWIAALLLGFAVATSVYSQQGRLLPANGKLGELGSAQQAFPLVQIGSDLLRLSPGALIFDQSNRTILHGALPGSGAVLYTQDPGGNILRLYLLRPDELERIQHATQR